jgi:hypothetical protein
MSRKFLFVLAFIILIPCVGFAASDVTLELEGRFWWTDLQGKMKVTDSNDIGTDIDLVSRMRAIRRCGSRGTRERKAR